MSIFRHQNVTGAIECRVIGCVQRMKKYEINRDDISGLPIPAEGDKDDACGLGKSVF
jgi:hypothetical protein